MGRLQRGRRPTRALDMEESAGRRRHVGFGRVGERARGMAFPNITPESADSGSDIDIY